MKIGMIAANGQAGQAIAKEAVARGHHVTAIVRSENKSSAQEVLQKHAFDLTREELLEFDVLVNAFGVWTPETLPDHARLAGHLTRLLADSPVGLVVVGGAGSLYLDASQRLMVRDCPDFPEDYRAVAEAMAAGLAVYRQAKGVNWLYLSSATDFDTQGERTGVYTLAGEALEVNEQGQSYISYADYALALLYLVEKGGYQHERLSAFS